MLGCTRETGGRELGPSGRCSVLVSRHQLLCAWALLAAGVQAVTQGCLGRGRAPGPEATKQQA